MNGFLMHREMFCKIAGILCILIAATGLSAGNNRRLHRQVREIRQLQQLLQLLQGELEYQCAALPEAFRRCAAHLQGECAIWMQRMEQRLEEYEGLGFQEIWEQELERFYGNTVLSEECLMNLKQLGSQFAFVDRDTQLRGIRLCAMRLEEEESRLTQELPRKLKMGTGLMLLAGCFLVILLI